MISLSLMDFLGAGQIQNLTIDGETDIRQCINHAPLFRWQTTDSTDETSALLQIHLLKDREDSLIWTSDILSNPGNFFHFRSLGALTDGNTYCFSIKSFSKDTSRYDFKSIYFTMNSPPSEPIVIAEKPPVLEDGQILFPPIISRDQQIPSTEIVYRVQILIDSLAANVIADTLIPAANILKRPVFFSFNTMLLDNTAYYYRVRASDGVEYSNWSPQQKFYVNQTNNPPNSFDLIYPIHGDTLVGFPVLEWQKTGDPEARFGVDSVYYIIEYSTDSSFNYYVKKVRTSGQHNKLILNKLQNHETYYWHVFAVDTRDASRKSVQTGKFTLNTGNQIPSIPRILSPLDKQILTPNQYILWRFDDDPDKVDRLSFTLIILDHLSKEVVFREFISDSMLIASRFCSAEDFSVGYNNLAQYQLRRINPSILTDSRYYDVQVDIIDNWGGHVSTAWDNASFQYDDNINTPPSAPTAGFSPHNKIINTLHPLFSWNPVMDSDAGDRVKYRVQISRDSSFTNTRYITQDSRYETAKIRLKTGLIENTLYYWRVRSMDLEETSSAWSKINQFTVNQYNEAPRNAVPTIFPADLTEINTEGIFWWRPVFDPDPGDSISYILEIDPDSRFAESIIRHDITSCAHGSGFCLSDTLFYPLMAIPGHDRLRDNQLYYWRIIAIDKAGISGPTPDTPLRFVYNQYNDPPEIVNEGFSPRNEQIINTRQPILQWSPASDPDFSDLQSSLTYRIQLSPDALFIDKNCLEYQTNSSENSFHLVETLEENKKYYYRVQAVDSHGARSAWSTINSFITNETREPPFSISGGFIPKDSLIVKTSDPIISWLPTTDPDPGQYARDFSYSVRYFLTKKPRKYYYSKSEKGVPSIQLQFLKEDEYYGYQVAATDPDGLTGMWSAVHFFGINAFNSSPVNFQLISPRSFEDSVLTDRSFQWTISSDNDIAASVHYILYYSTDSTFNTNGYELSIESDDSLVVDYRPVVPLERKTKYFWKVAAIDNDGNQTWGSNSNNNPFIFTTIGYNKYNYTNFPQQFFLHQNYPNPFNRQTNIKYSVAELGPVDVTIYDILGKRIKSLANGQHQPGTYEVTWDGTDSGGSPVPGGMYICRMSARNFSSNKKVLLMK